MYYRFPAEISLHKSNPSDVNSMSSPWSRGVISLGVMPNAGVGEAGHRRHKRGNKSGSGRREMAKHHMRRVNTELALEALLDGTSRKKFGSIPDETVCTRP